MLEQAESKAARDLSPDEIIRNVGFRFRICNYLFKAAAAWIFFGAAVIVISIAFNVLLRGLFLIAASIGWGLFTAAFTLTLAIYRCPVCDTYLSRFRPDKLHCPGCDAQIKLSE